MSKVIHQSVNRKYVYKHFETNLVHILCSDNRDRAFNDSTFFTKEVTCKRCLAKLKKEKSK